MSASKLLVISHTAHYGSSEAPVGWGPTVREIDHLAGVFDEVRHVAPLHSGLAPPSALPYGRENVRFVPVRPAGGASWTAKLRVLAALPGYARTIVREIGQCDAVHVRCPANIGLLALVILVFSHRPRLRWIKYAGNWAPTEPEPWSYRFQRWILKGGSHGGVVTVNGAWPHQPPFVRSFLNPCLTEEELGEGRRAADDKRLSAPMRLLFVGRLDEAKGCGRVLDVLGGLADRGVPAALEVIGDGPDRERFAARARALSLDGAVRFFGLQPRGALAPFYARAHFLVIPSTSSEGWPKVLSEGMAYGAVPITSDVSSIPQYLKTFEIGRALPARDVNGFASALCAYAGDPERWRAESRRGIAAAARFSYGRYVEAVRELFGMEQS